MKPFSFGDKIGLLRGGQNRSGRKDSARPFARMMAALGMSIMLAGCNPATDDKIVTPDQLPYSQILAENKTEYSKKIEAQADRFAQFPVPVVFLDEDAITLNMILREVDLEGRSSLSYHVSAVRDQLVRQTGYDFASSHWSQRREDIFPDRRERYTNLADTLRGSSIFDGNPGEQMRLPSRFRKGVDYRGASTPEKLCVTYGANASFPSLRKSYRSIAFYASSGLDKNAVPNRAEWDAFETYRQAALCQADEFLGEDLGEAKTRGWVAQHQAQVFADSFAALQLAREGNVDAIARFRDLRALGTVLNGKNYTKFAERTHMESYRVFGFVMNTALALDAILKDVQTHGVDIAAMDDAAALDYARKTAREYTASAKEMEALAEYMSALWDGKFTKSQSKTFEKILEMALTAQENLLRQETCQRDSSPDLEEQRAGFTEELKEYIKKNGDSVDGLARFITASRETLRAKNDADPCDAMPYIALTDVLRHPYHFNSFYRKAKAEIEAEEKRKIDFGPRR